MDVRLQQLEYSPERAPKDEKEEERGKEKKRKKRKRGNGMKKKERRLAGMKRPKIEAEGGLECARF